MVRTKTATQGERGRRIAARFDLTEFDLVGDLVRKIDAADGENHFGRQFFVALETAGSDGVAHRLFNLALRGDADLLEKSAQAGVENIFVHDDLLIALDHTRITALHEPSSFEARKRSHLRAWPKMQPAFSGST